MTHLLQGRGAREVIVGTELHLRVGGVRVGALLLGRVRRRVGRVCHARVRAAVPRLHDLCAAVACTQLTGHRAQGSTGRAW